MFQRACDKIVTSGINNGYITEDDRDVHIYGMNMFFVVCINIISMLIIGVLTNRLWECIVFCIVYKTIRKYTGGFHFENALHCYISSCLMYFLAIALIEYIPFEIYGTTIAVSIAAVVLWYMSPVEAVNKPLDECEKKVFGKRAKISIVGMFISYLASLLISKEVAQVIAIGIIFVMFFAIVGKIQLSHK